MAAKVEPQQIYREVAEALLKEPGLRKRDFLRGWQHNDRIISRLGGWDSVLNQARDLLPCPVAEKGYIAPDLPEELAPVGEIVARRKAEFARKDSAVSARKLVPIKIKLNGPIGICHFGDPHVDDPGTDIALLERHTDLVRETEGLFAGNVGDVTNNWVGRLMRLYADQSTTAAEAWALAEWFVGRCDWLYLVRGNHDLWSGAGDPLNWITRSRVGVSENVKARLGLQFPNGRDVRVHVRHSFPGHSQWNAAHGVSKAAQMTWKDHILVCGHKHVSALNVNRDAQTGILSHCVQVASYKIHDRYADELGLRDQAISANYTTIINPEAEREEALVTGFWDLESAADYLKFLRRDAK